MKRSHFLVALLITATVAALASATAEPPPEGPVIEAVTVESVSLTVGDGRVDRRLQLTGRGFLGTSFGPFVRFETADGTTYEASIVVLESETRVLAFPPEGLRGPVTVVLENPDHRTTTVTAEL